MATTNSSSRQEAFVAMSNNNASLQPKAPDDDISYRMVALAVDDYMSVSVHTSLFDGTVMSEPMPSGTTAMEDAFASIGMDSMSMSLMLPAEEAEEASERNPIPDVDTTASTTRAKDMDLHDALKSMASASEVKEILQSATDNNKSITKSWDENMTPLHRAMRMAAPDEEVILSIIEFDPEVITMQDDVGRTPLHWSIKNIENGISPVIVQALLKNAPEAAKIRDHGGCLPLHCVTTRTSFQSVEDVYKSYPEAVTVLNKYRETPLHKLCQHVAKDGIVKSPAAARLFKMLQGGAVDSEEMNLTGARQTRDGPAVGIAHHQDRHEASPWETLMDGCLKQSSELMETLDVLQHWQGSGDQLSPESLNKLQMLSERMRTISSTVDNLVHTAQELSPTTVARLPPLHPREIQPAPLTTSSAGDLASEMSLPSAFTPSFRFDNPHTVASKSTEHLKGATNSEPHESRPMEQRIQAGRFSPPPECRFDQCPVLPIVTPTKVGSSTDGNSPAKASPVFTVGDTCVGEYQAKIKAERVFSRRIELVLEFYKTGAGDGAKVKRKIKGQYDRIARCVRECCNNDVHKYCSNHPKTLDLSRLQCPNGLKHFHEGRAS
ncbi:expressed unknown protein [Seminavis robusta]|uniref:Ankyrin repeat protein n=1 Tax=Seminavis robusta TaxID=568900 RepID=A0A9N8EDW8_9STRA|nr:expressed unknown protein [Seminavis robusta]|eukprot:Sro853_g211180.1 n/a (607) ;mRNA; f:38141-40057